jgi:hypothetical protein
MGRDRQRHPRHRQISYPHFSSHRRLQWGHSAPGCGNDTQTSLSKITLALQWGYRRKSCRDENCPCWRVTSTSLQWGYNLPGCRNLRWSRLREPKSPPPDKARQWDRVDRGSCPAGRSMQGSQTTKKLCANPLGKYPSLLTRASRGAMSPHLSCQRRHRQHTRRDHVPQKSVGQNRPNPK